MWVNYTLGQCSRAYGKECGNQQKFDTWTHNILFRLFQSFLLDIIWHTPLMPAINKKDVGSHAVAHPHVQALAAHSKDKQRSQPTSEMIFSSFHAPIAAQMNGLSSPGGRSRCAIFLE